MCTGASAALMALAFRRVKGSLARGSFNAEAFLATAEMRAVAVERAEQGLLRVGLERGLDLGGRQRAGRLGVAGPTGAAVAGRIGIAAGVGIAAARIVPATPAIAGRIRIGAAVIVGDAAPPGTAAPDGIGIGAAVIVAVGLEGRSLAADQGEGAGPGDPAGDRAKE